MSEVVTTSGGSRAIRSHRISWVILFCFVVIAGVIVMAAFGELIAPQDPNKQDLASALAKPSGEHWLGTDSLGRDVTSRIIVGARSAFLGPFVIAVGAALLGSILGLLAGFYGGRTDSVFMRYVDLMFALPGLLVIIVVSGTFGGGYWFAVTLLVILTMPFDLRIARAATLEQVPRPYVEAAKTLGVSDWRIMYLHIWPNISSVVVAQVFLGFAGAIVALSGLSFLGFGISPGTPDWGLMVSEGRNLLFVTPVAVLAQAIAIILPATCMNLLGDWSYERLQSRGANR